MLEKAAISEAPFVNSKTKIVNGISETGYISVGSTDEIWTISKKNGFVHRRLPKIVVGTNAPEKVASISANDKRVAFVSISNIAYVYEVSGVHSAAWNKAGLSRAALIAPCSNGNTYAVTQEGKNEFALYYGKPGAFAKVSKVPYRLTSISCD